MPPRTAAPTATQNHGRRTSDGRACLRACFVNFRTTPDQVALVLEVAAELGRAPR